MSTGIEIRRYAAVPDMQADVQSMAAAGWQLVAQTEASGGARSELIGTGIALTILGFLLFVPIVLVGLIVLAAGFVMRRKELVVTYRYVGAG